MKFKILVALVILCAASASGQKSTYEGIDSTARALARAADNSGDLPAAYMEKFIFEAVSQTDYYIRPYEAFDTIWTVALQSDYALNSDCHQDGVVSVKLLVDSTNAKYEALREMRDKDIGQSEEYETATTPKFYSQWGTYLTLSPAPTDEYRVEIKYQARILVSDSSGYENDSLLYLPAECEQMVVIYAAAKAMERLGDFYRADRLMAQWEKAVGNQRAMRQRQPDLMVSPQKELGQ